MGDHIDEAKGELKKGVGKMTGDREMEAEGRAERETARTRRKVKGTANRTKGNLQEGLGRVTGDDERVARGTADRIKGDTQRAG